MSEQLIRLPALLTRTGLAIGVVRGLCHRNEIHPIKIGRAIYFDYEEVRGLIEIARQRREPAAEGVPAEAA